MGPISTFNTILYCGITSLNDWKERESNHFDLRPIRIAFTIIIHTTITQGNSSQMIFHKLKIKSNYLAHYLAHQLQDLPPWKKMF